MNLQFDITTWAGISAATLLIVSSLKIIARKLIDGHEEVAAGLVGLVLGIAALTTGAMAFQPGTMGWVQAIVGGITAGAAAGVGHDKLLNPVMRAVFPVKSGEVTTGTSNTGAASSQSGAEDEGR